MEPVEVIPYRGYNISIYQDEMAEHPRQFDNLGTMICYKPHADLSDHEKSNCEDIKDVVYQLLPEEHIMPWIHGKGETIEDTYELSHYEVMDRINEELETLLSFLRHSHILEEFVIRTYNGAKIEGVIYATHEDVKKWFLLSSLNERDIEKATKVLKAEIDEYEAYCNGEVYGYQITKKGDEEVLDSCWGFYGYWDENRIVQTAKGAVDCFIESAIERHIQKLKSYIRYRVPLQHRQPLAI
jgi:hypothetical protein